MLLLLFQNRASQATRTPARGELFAYEAARILAEQKAEPKPQAKKQTASASLVFPLRLQCRARVQSGSPLKQAAAAALALPLSLRSRLRFISGGAGREAEDVRILTMIAPSLVVVLGEA